VSGRNSRKHCNCSALHDESAAYSDWIQQTSGIVVDQRFALPDSRHKPFCLAGKRAGLDMSAQQEE